MKKKRLAIIGVGMVGSGVLDQGIPVMAKTLEKITETIDITLYSFIPIRKSKIPKQLSIRYAPFFLPGTMKFYWLLLLFSLDHLRRKYDCIHAQSPFPAGKLALQLKRIFKVHWITTIHAGEIADLPDQQFGDWRNKNLKKITRNVCEKSDQLVFMSDYQAKDLEENLGTQRSYQVLPRGIEVNPIPHKEVSYPIQLLHIGYHHPIKNQMMLLDVIKLVTEKIPCTIKIIGSNYGNEFRYRISQLGLDKAVTLVGALPYHEMKDYYSKADFLVHTSWFEGLPMVAIEAMAYGVVVCGTHVGIMADLSGDCCETVPTGDARELSKLILEYVENPVKYEALRMRAHKWAKEHDLNWHVDKLMKIYFPEIG